VLFCFFGETEEEEDDEGGVNGCHNFATCGMMRAEGEEEGGRQ